MFPTNYILASASPRRKELLKLVVNSFKCVTADIEENCPDNITLEKRPEYLALQKAEFVFEKNPDFVVIGADTAVFLKNKMLGKPENEQDAKKILSELSGKTHKVITGCAIVSADKTISFSVCSKVTFYKLSTEEIKNYIATKEPFDKAGAYGIQGFGGLLVKKISGDYFNIVGLPVAELNRRLKEAGLL